MIANYGYADGSGEYFISINTDLCLTCEEKPCVLACPAQIFEIEMNDYDELVSTVKSDCRKTLKYTCAPCKPVNRSNSLPCTSACTPGAIRHSW